VLAGILAAGCNDPAAPEAVIDVAGWAAAVAAAECSARGDCCTEAAFAFDESACRTGVAAAYEGLAQLDDVAFDGEAAAACAALVTPSPERCGATGLDEPPCRAALLGRRPAGAACESGAQCAPIGGGPSTCATDPGSGIQVCRAFDLPRRAGRGEPCGSTCDGRGCSSGPSPFCDAERDDLRCAPSGRCEPLAAPGEACSLEDVRGDRRSCAAGTWCDGTTCVSLLGEGESCRTCDDRGCTADPFACVDPLACVAPGGDGLYRCGARLPLGAACSPDAGGRDCESGACSRACTTFPCAGAGWACVKRISESACADSADTPG